LPLIEARVLSLSKYRVPYEVGSTGSPTGRWAYWRSRLSKRPAW